MLFAILLLLGLLLGNETIKRNTVEDRRHDEIKSALQKRQEIREENARRKSEVPTVRRFNSSSAMPDIEITSI